MKHEITQELVIALENLATIAEEVYKPDQVTDADDIIAAQSIAMARELANKWRDKQQQYEITSQTI